MLMSFRCLVWIQRCCFLIVESEYNVVVSSLLDLNITLLSRHCLTWIQRCYPLTVGPAYNVAVLSLLDLNTTLLSRHWWTFIQRCCLVIIGHEYNFAVSSLLDLTITLFSHCCNLRLSSATSAKVENYDLKKIYIYVSRDFILCQIQIGLCSTRWCFIC